ncbi:flagellar biosynthesis protein FlhA [Caldithrix abyssi DSM 13497]|uniref:Flagellar biosynthesis protein FlhA n=1 Tax=Caldithrix abyssi DSM 13497 TaxID=880073 RepID=H1XQ12_CALAY|nr:flagellar biosynthesis protein FlhA [Caldithrix abyssi]APF18238.1 flagellar biosynthesis protein FlhA [Caldithrix abyssi DSM 13497]EHO42263.1 flagellar biosynthesis protein FlhA [Caldithrix abyssi DSM 13497]
MADQNSKFITRLASSSSWMLTAGIVLILAVMILPMPSFLLDTLLVMNISAALLVLFVTLFILRPMDFSVFPGLLLILTLFRLSLNIASTRLILSQGYAGEIIASFGSFVVQGNFVVGIVIFLILVIINFVVITKGANRIAEVSARFTLDAMPGKQMAIDADLNAGLIDDVEAQKRRGEIAREADFYGAMDGASKFVRGDAIAGLLITLINLIGGLLIGAIQRGLTLSEAASTYTLLTVGDGLVAQVPALLISVASGIVITRASASANMGDQLTSQLVAQPKAIYAASGVAFLMGLMPGMPFIPFTVVALVMAVIARQIEVFKRRELAAQQEEEEIEAIEEPERIEEFLHPDPFEIELGYGLIPLVDANQGGNLLKRISTIRKSLAIELGILVPPIRIRDNIQLNANEYVFKIYGVKAAGGQVMLDRYMVVNPDKSLQLRGIEMEEPTFGLPALWVNEEERERAEIAGNTVVEAPAVIATHLMEILRNNAYKLLDRQETQRMLDHLKETHAALVEGLVPDNVSLGTIRSILKNLLRERIPIRNLVTILETIADYAPFSKDADVLTEYVRSALAETITEILKVEEGYVAVALLEPKLEDHILSVIREGGAHLQNLGFTPQQVNNLFEDIANKIEDMSNLGVQPALLVSPQIRRAVRKFTETIFPNLFVVAYSELTADTEVKSVGTVRYPHES